MLLEGRGRRRRGCSWVIVSKVVVRAEEDWLGW